MQHARMRRRAWTVADGISPNRSAGAGAAQTCSAATCFFKKEKKRKVQRLVVWFPDSFFF
jgi:hypothetical protein